MPPDEKRCFNCKETKSAAEFYKDRSRKDGLAGRCKPCDAAARKFWAFDTSADSWNEYRKQHAKTPQGRSTRLDGWHRRRAILAEAFVEDVDRVAIWGRDEGHCRRCIAFVPFDKMHLDHIVPLSKGGEHSYYKVRKAHLVTF